MICCCCCCCWSCIGCENRRFGGIGGCADRAVLNALNVLIVARSRLRGRSEWPTIGGCLLPSMANVDGVGLLLAPAPMADIFGCTVVRGVLCERLCTIGGGPDGFLFGCTYCGMCAVSLQLLAEFVSGCGNDAVVDDDDDDDDGANNGNSCRLAANRDELFINGAYDACVDEPCCEYSLFCG